MLGDEFADFFGAVFGIRVRAQHLRLAVATGSIGQEFHDADHGFRVGACLDEKPHAEGIRLELIIASVFHDAKVRHSLCDLGTGMALTI